MLKKGFFLIILAHFFFSFCFAQTRVTIEQEMFTIDLYSYPLEEYERVLSSISGKFAEYDREDIGSKVIELYDQMKKDYPELSVYEILEELNNLSSQMEGLKFPNLVKIYKFLKAQGELEE